MFSPTLVVTHRDAIFAGREQDLVELRKQDQAGPSHGLDGINYTGDPSTRSLRYAREPTFSIARVAPSSPSGDAGGL